MKGLTNVNGHDPGAITGVGGGIGSHELLATEIRLKFLFDGENITGITGNVEVEGGD